MFGFMFNAALTAVNVAFYAYSGSPFSLAAAIFCGFMALFCLALELS